MCGQWKQITLALLLCLLSALSLNAQDKTPKAAQKVIGYTITLVDGYSFDVDEAADLRRLDGQRRQRQVIDDVLPAR